MIPLWFTTLEVALPPPDVLERIREANEQGWPKLQSMAWWTGRTPAFQAVGSATMLRPRADGSAGPVCAGSRGPCKCLRIWHPNPCHPAPIFGGPWLPPPRSLLFSRGQRGVARVPHGSSSPSSSRVWPCRRVPAGGQRGAHCPARQFLPQGPSGCPEEGRAAQR